MLKDVSAVAVQTYIMSFLETPNNTFSFQTFLEEYSSILPSWVIRIENRHKRAVLTLHKWPS